MNKLFRKLKELKKFNDSLKNTSYDNFSEIGFLESLTKEEIKEKNPK